MSDPRIAGPLSALVVPGADAVKEHRSSPIHVQNDNRAYCGGLLLGAAGFIAVTLGSDAPNFPLGYLLGYAGAVCLGLLLLITGLRGARSERNPLGALLALIVPVGGFVAVSNYAPGLLDLPFARAACAGIGVANLVRFWISIRGPGSGSAEKMVRQQIAQNEIVWRGVKRR